MITIEQLKDIKDRTEALHRYLQIDQKQMEVEEEELRTQAPGFWDDQKVAEAQMKKVKTLKRWIDGYNEVKAATDDTEVAFDFYKEEMSTEEEVDGYYAQALKLIEDLELKNMLQGEADNMDAVLKINAGAGGTEAQDWAQMLMRMYQRYAEQHGYKVTISSIFRSFSDWYLYALTGSLVGSSASALCRNSTRTCRNPLTRKYATAHVIARMVASFLSNVRVIAVV